MAGPLNPVEWLKQERKIYIDVHYVTLKSGYIVPVGDIVEILQQYANHIAVNRNRRSKARPSDYTRIVDKVIKDNKEK